MLGRQPSRQIPLLRLLLRVCAYDDDMQQEMANIYDILGFPVAADAVTFGLPQRANEPREAGRRKSASRECFNILSYFSANNTRADGFSLLRLDKEGAILTL